MEKCENLTLRGTFITGALFKTQNRLHPIFFGKLHLDNLSYTVKCFSWISMIYFFLNHQWTSLSIMKLKLLETGFWVSGNQFRIRKLKLLETGFWVSGNQFSYKGTEVTENQVLSFLTSAWHDGAVVSASGWRSGGPRFKPGPSLISPSWSSYQVNQLGSKAASDSILKHWTFAGYQILVYFTFTLLHFFYFFLENSVQNGIEQGQKKGISLPPRCPVHKGQGGSRPHCPRSAGAPENKVTSIGPKVLVLII